MLKRFREEKEQLGLKLALRCAARRAPNEARRIWHTIRTCRAPEFRDPTAEELAALETRCLELNMPLNDWTADAREFCDFVARGGFPPDYHGGLKGGVFHEKLLEHFVAWKLLGIERGRSTPYLDVAACGSPWALILRRKGIEAYANDLALHAKFSGYDYYRREDATATGFATAALGGASLQCAYEMFSGDADIRLLGELGRIIRPGGRVVIVPLYLHAIPCYYQSIDHFGRLPGDPGATGFVRRQRMGVSFCRFYSPETLRERVWNTAQAAGFAPSLYLLGNARDLGEGIYLRYFLILDRLPSEQPASENSAASEPEKQSDAPEILFS